MEGWMKREAHIGGLESCNGRRHPPRGAGFGMETRHRGYPTGLHPWLNEGKHPAQGGVPGLPHAEAPTLHTWRPAPPFPQLLLFWRAAAVGSVHMQPPSYIGMPHNILHGITGNEQRQSRSSVSPAPRFAGCIPSLSHGCKPVGQPPLKRLGTEPRSAGWMASPSHCRTHTGPGGGNEIPTYGAAGESSLAAVGSPCSAAMRSQLFIRVAFLGTPIPAA